MERRTRLRLHAARVNGGNFYCAFSPTVFVAERKGRALLMNEDHSIVAMEGQKHMWTRDEALGSLDQALFFNPESKDALVQVTGQRDPNAEGSKV